MTQSYEANAHFLCATPVEPRDNLRLWTDDFNNIIQILK